MRRMRKKIVAFSLSVLMGIGLISPMGNAGNVKAAEADGWDVEIVQNEDIGDACSIEQNSTDTDAISELSEDSLEVAAAPGCVTVQGTNNYTYAYQVLNIVNQRRAENGLSPLTMDKDLLDAAMLRAAEITIKFSHTRPSGQSCDTVSYKVYGENIAYGYGTPDDVMKAWMNSTGHRENILTADYTSIGVGCFYKNGTYYWVQLFGYNTPSTISQPADKNVSVDVVTDLNSYNSSYTLESRGIDVVDNDPVYGFIAYMNTNAPDDANIEYSWYASADNGNSWILLQDWDSEAQGFWARANQFGEYLIVAKARKAGDDSTIVSDYFSYGCHPVIKGICQMPYTGAGGGYLIGIESYDNPEQTYRYEMLILDCTLYSQGKDAWVYTTGRCTVPENCLWTVWQPQYGYYWTLFRVYDASGTLIDEMCYGFVNAY